MEQFLKKPEYELFNLELLWKDTPYKRMLEGIKLLKINSQVISPFLKDCLLGKNIAP